MKRTLFNLAWVFLVLVQLTLGLGSTLQSQSSLPTAQTPAGWADGDKPKLGTGG